MLDASILQDLRYSFRCYETNIARTVSGAKLPKPGPLCIENRFVPGCWLFRVVAAGGVEVCAAPADDAAVVATFDRGQFVRGAEWQGDWLRLCDSEEAGKDPALSRTENDAYDEYIRKLMKGIDPESDEDEDAPRGRWILAKETGGDARLQLVTEEDTPNVDAEVPDVPEADIFDRPFEPRLEEPNAPGDDEAVAEEEPISKRVEASSSEPVVLPPLVDELPLDCAVVLEGLSRDGYNGQHATIVTKKLETGRQGVKLEAGGEKISIKPVNLRPVLPTENGPLAKHARVMGLTLAALGLGQEGAVDDRYSGPAVELLGAAFRAAQRDLALEAVGARSDLDAAHSALAAALAEHSPQPCQRSTTSESVEPQAPHVVIERGALGGRAAEAARLSGSTCSIDEIEEGTDALRALLEDERRRLARTAVRFTEGADALRLRLTLVRALLRGRREVEALAEAEAACKSAPKSAAASLWHGRCLLRAGKRAQGLQLLEAAAEANFAEAGADGAWAVAEAATRLRAVRKAEVLQRRADGAYARGSFSDAAVLYGEALASSAEAGDDKWGRAEMLANRAACRRRAREFRGALEDLDVALGLFPRYKRAVFRKGVCLLEFGQPSEAVKCFEQLLRMERSWPNILEWLVRAHSMQRRADAGFTTPDDFMQAGVKADGWTRAADERDIATETDHYAVLGVSADATDKQLKKAYRLMSLKFHPDKEGGSTRAFQRVATAYETLSDPERRRRYDDGADIQKNRNDSSDSDDEREKQSVREEIERKYFPERYKFWPFGDPHVEKRKREERRRQREGRPAWTDEI
eukprot:gnl/TRDRNA2_/TRDRNA2_170983_c1_seq2.p1 gnl/TRDRNA2_/TRDRNA2_170983_c1~~gnl/TRDRNA2_/TRDRNA2_170983_c1_seq2.p1  ORF type:complete len:809 (+),score=170.28 gnl/TRDRNA2_/TRDRNA2_170983_c1_seq2:692-3118(+)